MPNKSPLRVETSTIELVPEKIARDFCVLPHTHDSISITLYCPNGQDFIIANEESLRFALDRIIKWLPVPASAIQDAIEIHYPDTEATIHNCTLSERFICPQKWALLAPTERPDQRFCEKCQETIYRCDSVDEAFRMSDEGKCVAYVDDEGIEYLG